MTKLHTPFPDRSGLTRPLTDAEFEELAVVALHAWNNVPREGNHFAWPKDFPEGCRAAWRRVVTAIVAASSNGRTPHFDCGNAGSSPAAASSASEVWADICDNKRDPLR